MSKPRYALLVFSENFLWFSVHVVIALIPAIAYISFMWIKQGGIFEPMLVPSLSLFVFSLLLAGVYVFFPSASKDNNWHITLVFCTVALGLLFTLVFTYYNTTAETRTWLSDNILAWRILLFVSFITILLLNYPTIRQKITSKKQNYLEKKAKKVTEKGDDWITRLRSRG